MLTSSSAIEEVLTLAPEWKPVLDSVKDGLESGSKPRTKDVSLADLFDRLGAKSLYLKALALGDERGKFVSLLRDHYYQP
ncbi:MAG: hypothetical protein JSS86_20695, partial [Cyanobacteria bacterium SZAS LIN-2]|nr:hypothetical protein [Cyanobacteria bacterium SZAS LIN-2]